MSRNKTINLLHETTLKSFKDCRAALKRNKWDFAAAYIELLGGLDWHDFGATLSKAIDAIMPAINAAINAFEGLTNSLRMQKLAEPPDVNNPNTPVFAPYYASVAGNGKLYQNDGERNTDETGA